jgi:hypothetical protein
VSLTRDTWVMNKQRHRESVRNELHPRSPVSAARMSILKQASNVDRVVRIKARFI